MPVARQTFLGRIIENNIRQYRIDLLFQNGTLSNWCRFRLFNDRVNNTGGFNVSSVRVTTVKSNGRVRVKLFPSASAECCGPAKIVVSAADRLTTGRAYGTPADVFGIRSRGNRNILEPPEASPQPQPSNVFYDPGPPENPGIPFRSFARCPARRKRLLTCTRCGY